MQRFFRWEDIGGKEPKRGVSMKVLSGEKGMMVLFYIAPKVEIETHSHPHEQMGTVLKGEITLEIDGEERLLRAGDCYIAPSNTPHSARAGREGAQVIDFFSPPREDYK